MKNSGKAKKKNPRLPNQAVSAYAEGATPLGSYTALPGKWFSPENPCPAAMSEAKYI